MRPYHLLGDTTILYYVPKPGTSGQHAEDYNPQVYKDGTVQAEGWLTPEEFEARFPTPTPSPPALDTLKVNALSRLAEKTHSTIMDGFSHTIDGITYRFNYDDEDQGNFAKANSAALLALVTGDSSYRQVWRGWIGDTPHVFYLTVDQYLALSRAGADHQLWWQQRYWDKEAAIKAAASESELNLIVI